MSTVTSSSPSPTISPKSSFHHRHHQHHPSSLQALRSSPKLHAARRRANPLPSSSPALSPANRRQYAESATAAATPPTPAPAASVPTIPPPPKTPSPAIVTSKRPAPATVDAGTQYTPPGLPPTAPREPAPPMEPATMASLLDSSRSSSGGSTKRRESDMDTDGAAPPPAVDSEPFPARAETLLNRTPATPSGVVNRATEIPDVSSNKRARAEDPAMKVMPVDYTKCDVRDLGVVIADMLMELVRINDPLPFQNDKLTRFHSRAPPGISVHDYLNRLIVHATLSAPILLSMVYYIDRLCALYPQFTISSLTVHRFLIASATVAAKGLSDSFWTNSTYARVGGITLKELALLELDFLDKMQWKIVPDPQVLEDYYRSLVERNDGFALSREGSVEKE